MYPTLHPGDCILFDRLAYRHGSPQSMDIVLVKHPLKRNMMMIKRIVGRPGTTVINRAGEFIVGGIPFNKAVDTQLNEDEKTILGQEEYFIVGDYLHQSLDDSRTLGPLPRQNIEARAWMIYWPPSRWQLL